MHAQLKKRAAGVSLFALLGLNGLAAQTSHSDSLLVEIPSAAGPVASQPAAAPAKKRETPVAPALPAPEKTTSGPESAPQIVPLATDGRGPDESALRYYASLQQTRRAETEMTRLQRLYPDWRPPENIFNTPAAGSVDEQPFWDLFALGKFDELRADIDKRMKKEPGWQPSGDLMDKIRRKETRNSITDLWKAGKWKDIIAFIKGNSQAVSDDTDVDILWTVAEAYAKTKQTADALNIYKSIMKNNREPEQRLATVQKAMAVLRMKDVEELIAMAKIDSRGRNELDVIAIDITRGRISAYLHDERSEPIPETELKSFEDYARKDKDPNQPGLAAWYYYKNKVFTQSLEWFKFALEIGGDSMIAHGLAHSLRELGMYRETEEVAYAWREPLVNNAILFIDILERDLTREIPPYIEPERLLRYAQVTMDNAAGEGAQGLAWYAYNSCQFTIAHEWFERAVAWLPKEATVYGYALTLQKLKKTKEFWDVINRYDGLFPKVIDIIYPDDLYHPPNPCDLVESHSKQRAGPNGRKGFTVPAPHVPGQPQPPQPFGASSYGVAPPYAAAPSSASYGGAPGGALAAVPAVPGPQPLAAGQAPNPYAPQQAIPGQMAMPGQMLQQGNAGYYQNTARVYRREPQIDRKNFPVSVESQNPLRSFPSGRYMGPQPQAASRMIAPPSPLFNEPPIGMRVLVARRVPDVARMPYERWGYTLLPGYNGIATATGPHSSEKAPSGTLWTTLQAKDAASTRAGALDPLRQDVEALLRRMTTIARVPPPGASVTGPWRAPAPYKSREQLEAEGLVPPVNASAGPADIRPSPSLTPAASTLPSRAAGPGAPAIAPPGTQNLPAIATNPAAPRPVQPQSPTPPPEGRVESHARDALGQQVAELYNRKQYTEALEALDRRLQVMPETTDLRLIRAWSLLNLNKVDEAKRVFGTLASTKQPRTPNLGTR